MCAQCEEDGRRKGGDDLEYRCTTFHNSFEAFQGWNFWRQSSEPDNSGEADDVAQRRCGLTRTPSTLTPKPTVQDMNHLPWNTLDILANSSSFRHLLWHNIPSLLSLKTFDYHLTVSLTTLIDGNELTFLCSLALKDGASNLYVPTHCNSNFIPPLLTITKHSDSHSISSRDPPMTASDAGPGPKPINFVEISLAPMDADDGSNESFIFTTLLYDKLLIQSPENAAASFNTPCPFYLLEHQWTRLQVANWCTSYYRKGEPSNGCGGPSNFLHGLSRSVRQWQEQNRNQNAESLRIKIRSYISGRITTEIQPARRAPLTTLFKTTFGAPDQISECDWTVVLDCQATEATESTMYKTSDRFPYGRARAMAGIESLSVTKEVLLYNTENDIMDGSIATPYFYRNGRWVTPISSCGGLQGTTRRWALENGLCVEGTISKDDLKSGEPVWLSTGVKGFFAAKLVPRDVDTGVLDTEQCRRFEREMNIWPGPDGRGL